MTDNEIIKALKCCGHGRYKTNKNFCNDCPMGCKANCGFDLLKNALDLINRLKAEIEWLMGHEMMADALDLINRQKAEIERLQNKVEELSEVLSDTIRIRYAECRAETIEDVLLTLEAEAASSDKYISEYDDSEVQKAANQALWKAYNLVKEMAGEDK